jgi:hypothetical protein
MLGYFVKRTDDSGSPRRADEDVSSGRLTLPQQMEMAALRESRQTMRAMDQSGTLKLDPVLRRHLGMEKR